MKELRLPGVRHQAVSHLLLRIAVRPTAFVSLTLAFSAAADAQYLDDSRFQGGAIALDRRIGLPPASGNFNIDTWPRFELNGVVHHCGPTSACGAPAGPIVPSTGGRLGPNLRACRPGVPGYPFCEPLRAGGRSTKR
ncbi:hypothetical protein [Bradyrhizobium liaoningense]|uniref:hypothetical protein n=1 Tax=Bradyrhizobium liaoningense TaxID=43992 RepID=UPI00138B05A6|nr:hypothetical protein [Bradyrhizobium liaoningense]